MTDAPHQHPDPPSAAAAPKVIILPPPEPVPEPYQPRSGSEKRKRQHVKQGRFDDDELAEFQRRARALKLSGSAFIRARTLDDPGPRSQRNLPTPDTKLLAQGISALNRVGNNLNQRARAYNELAIIARELGADRLEQILRDAMEQNQTEIEELRAAFNDIRRAFGWDDE